MIGRLVARAALTADEVRRMHALLESFFDGIGERRFRADLEEKNWVVLLEREDGRLAGFSTLLLYGERWAGRRITVVCSGDTIVEPPAWGAALLPRAWVRAVRALHARRGTGPLWWLLIVSGFRTYRFLPVFCREYFPAAEGTADIPARRAAGVRADGASDRGLGTVTRETGAGPASPRLRAMAGVLARRRFGDAYDPATGIVRLAEPQRLREGMREIPPRRRQDPHVAFFLRANPGYERGDELVCLARLDDANLTAAGLRMLYGCRRLAAGA